MIYTPMVQKAMKLAYAVHHGQTDRSGVPYIFHPYCVAEAVCAIKPDENFVCAALLHDVLEDTDVTAAQLEKEFPCEVTEAVVLLTHSRKEDYFDYIRQLKTNTIARCVKIFDLLHNLDQDRLSGAEGVTEEQQKAWSQKYRAAYEILSEDAYGEGTGRPD